MSKILTAVCVAGLALGQARADQPLGEQAKADLDGRSARLTASARAAFDAGDYAAARKMALAALELSPGNPEADEIHRQSIRAERKVRAAREVGERRPPTPEAMIERMTRARGTAVQAAAEPKKADWEIAVEGKLALKVSVGFKESRFSEVKDYLEGLLGCPVVIDRRFRDGFMLLPVSLTAKDMPLKQVLTWVVENDLGAKWVLSDGAVYVSDADGVTAKAGITEAYDVSDLLYLSEMPDFAGPELNPAIDANRVGVTFDKAEETEAPRRGLTPERLMRLIEQAVESGTWHHGSEEAKTPKP